MIIALGLILGVIIFGVIVNVVKEDDKKLACKRCGYSGNNFLEGEHPDLYDTTMHRCPKCGSDDVIMFKGAVEEVVEEYYKESDEY